MTHFGNSVDLTHQQRRIDFTKDWITLKKTSTSKEKEKQMDFKN